MKDAAAANVASSTPLPMMTTGAARPRLIVGTAGHIDHGKSSLVLALTGTDPDRLPEEKARGMTIDLGFAHTCIGGADIFFVDVPGHERFIRNMLAGAGAIDVALLIVAADDGVMPQTREHAELLSLLGVTRVLIVVTKCDLAAADWIDAVTADVTDLLGRCGLAPLATAHTSTRSGSGLEPLRERLAELASEVTPVAAAATSSAAAVPDGSACDATARPSAPRASAPATSANASGWFRLPIDRAFTIAGRGTVVTGTVLHGDVAVGEELDLWPAGERVRVRDLQSHGDPRDAARGRQRLALNLAGLPLERVGRGCELATPGVLSATRLLDCALLVWRGAANDTHRRQRVRVHTLTCEVLAELRVFHDDPPMAAGAAWSDDGPAKIARPDSADRGTAPLPQRAFGQLLTDQAIVAVYGQRFILRDESGQHTLGGGIVLHPLAARWTLRRRPTRAGLERLAAGSDAERCAEFTRALLWRPLSRQQFAGAAALPLETTGGLLADLSQRRRIRHLESGGQMLLWHGDDFSLLCDELRARLRAFRQANPRSAGVPLQAWPTWMPRACPERFRDALAAELIERGAVVNVNQHVLPEPPAQTGPALPPKDAALYQQILHEFADGIFQPPSLAALRCRTPSNERQVRELIRLATTRGDLVRIADDFWLHADSRQTLIEKITTELRLRGGLTVAEIRTLLNSSRKYVVPLCEYLDALGVTRREGDLRRLGHGKPPR